MSNDNFGTKFTTSKITLKKVKAKPENQWNNNKNLQQGNQRSKRYEIPWNGISSNQTYMRGFNLQFWKYGLLVWENKLLCLARLSWAERNSQSTKAGVALTTQKLHTVVKSPKIDISTALIIIMILLIFCPHLMYWAIS